MTSAQSALRSVQGALHDHLLGRPSAIAGELREGGGIDVAKRLAIYHHAYRARLLEAMQDCFERTWAYLGDDSFAAAAGEFIETHPSQHRNLRWYGAEFAPWLAQRFADDLEIGEVAALDWALRNAFDGADAAPVEVAELARLRAEDWTELGCRFVPTLCVEAVRFNSAAIWRALDQHETPPAAAALDEPRWLMIWRKEWQPHFRSIGAIEHSVLSSLRDGNPVAAVCAEVAASVGDTRAASTVADFLRGWVDEGLIGELTGIAGGTPGSDAVRGSPMTVPRA